jgi:hypothetical protein
LKVPPSAPYGRGLKVALAGTNNADRCLLVLIRRTLSADCDAKRVLGFDEEGLLIARISAPFRSGKLAMERIGSERSLQLEWNFLNS